MFRWKRCLGPEGRTLQLCPSPPPLPAIPVSPDLARNPPDGVSVGLVDEANMFSWELMLVGPSETM